MSHPPKIEGHWVRAISFRRGRVECSCGVKLRAPSDDELAQEFHEHRKAYGAPPSGGLSKARALT